MFLTLKFKISVSSDTPTVADTPIPHSYKPPDFQARENVDVTVSQDASWTRRNKGMNSLSGKAFE